MCVNNRSWFPGHAFLWKHHTEHDDPNLHNMLFDVENDWGVLIYLCETRVIGTDRWQDRHTVLFMVSNASTVCKSFDLVQTIVTRNNNPTDNLCFTSNQLELGFPAMPRMSPLRSLNTTIIKLATRSRSTLSLSNSSHVSIALCIATWWPIRKGRRCSRRYKNVSLFILPALFQQLGPWMLPLVLTIRWVVHTLASVVIQVGNLSISDSFFVYLLLPPIKLMEAYGSTSRKWG
jgi:hypothetical protein